jgi:hypothetical protein
MSSRRADALMPSSFRFEPVASFPCSVRCFICGLPTLLRPGVADAAFRADGELVGVVCPPCLSDESLVRLEKLREISAAAQPRRRAAK